MEITTSVELDFSKRKECFIRLHTQAPCEDAILFAEIFLDCCLACDAVQYGGKENAAVLLQCVNMGADLDRGLLESSNDFYQLSDQEVPEVHKTLRASLRFDLNKLEKFKYNRKPLMVWKQNLWEESALLMQRFLIRKHSSDAEFLSILARAMSLISQAYQERLLRKPGIRLRIAYDAAREYVNGMFRFQFKQAGLSDEEIDMRFAEAEFMEELDSAKTDEDIIAAANKALGKTKSDEDY
jgi:hypothetical protein